MKFVEYLKDRIGLFAIFFCAFALILFFLICFNINPLLIIYISFVLVSALILSVTFEYSKKSIFYNKIEKSLSKLDKKYLITEIITEPDFVEGKLLVDFLYEIDKSMIEEINRYKYSSEEFQEYLELWCHEIKTPIATSKLIIDNNQNEVTNSINEEIEKINNYAEQVLYYARSGVVEKDYSVSNVSLNYIIGNVIKRNKKDILFKQIKIDMNISNEEVKTDPKWIEFILNQILNNSIKYTNINGVIKIYVNCQKNNIELIIQDNGIGIKKEDLKKIYDKGFTGVNGRIIKNSTGIGLHLCKKLCSKLGINIIIESEENIGTIVKLVFPISSMNKIKD